MNTREVKYFAQSFTTSSDKLEIKYLSFLLVNLSSQVLLDFCCCFSGSPHPWRLGKLPQLFSSKIRAPYLRLFLCCAGRGEKAPVLLILCLRDMEWVMYGGLPESPGTWSCVFHRRKVFTKIALSEFSFLGFTDRPIFQTVMAHKCRMGKKKKYYSKAWSLYWLLDAFYCAFSECKFTCTSGKCLYLGSLVCNQQNDCGDNSDEENCLLVTEHPPPGIFNCKSLLLTLVSSSWMCFWNSEEVRS